MSSKKKKTVPSAETKKPENAEKAVDVAETQPNSVDTGKRTETKEVPAIPEPAFLGIDAVIAKVDKEMLKKAEDLGIPIGSLLMWAKSVDAKFNVVGSALQQLDKRFEGMPTEDSIANKFMEKLTAERQKALATRPTVQDQPQMQEQQQQQGGGEIATLLKVLEGSGGGGSEAEKYFVQLGMETASLSNFMTKEMFKTVMPQAFEEWTRNNPFKKATEAAKT